MRRTSIIAAAIGSLFVASSSFAGFTLTALPSAQAATGAGLVAYDIFAQNDADTTDGVNLQGNAITITTIGTKVKLANFDDGTGFLGDAWNFGSGAQQNTIVDVNSSNFRIGTRSAGQHTFTDYTGDATPYLTADEAANGLSTFSADYAVLSAAVSFPAGTAPGARFARVVVNNAGEFTVSGSFGGEAGSKSAASVRVVVGTTTPNVAPVVVPGSTSAVVFGQIVTSGAPFSVVVNVTDADAADVLSLTVGSVAGISGVTVTGGGTSPEAFTITGTVDYSLNGTTVVVPVTASDGTATGAGSFSLVVTPEPASLSLIGLSGLLMGRRRK